MSVGEIERGAVATRPAGVLPELDAHWMPFTANRAFKRAPRMLVRAHGMYYMSADGRRVLDAVAGLWCVNAGHSPPAIVEAIQRSAATLDFAPAFNMGHPDTFELAEQLSGYVPGLTRAFFTNSGSEAVDSALKIALAYQQARGETQRVRFVGRQRAYHGVGFGGLSVGGIEINKRAFAAQLLPHVDHLPHTHDLEHNAFTRGQPAWGAHLADPLEAIVAERGAETIAAVIIEPMAGSTGVLVPPLGYLERIRDICTKHDILLILDEVICAFGRLGDSFGANRFDIQADMITIAKGLTNGAVPMGAVLASDKLYDTITNAVPAGIELFHGYTYSGHPLAAAAALATLDVYRTEDLFARAASLEQQWEDAVHSLRGVPHVIDVRNLGLVAGIELESRAGAPGARAFEAFVQCFEAGVLVRVTGDTIALSPPLVIEPAQIDQIVTTLTDVLRRLA